MKKESETEMKPDIDEIKTFNTVCFPFERCDNCLELIAHIEKLERRIIELEATQDLARRVLEATRK